MSKFLIAGLGNIGEEYEFTRHNIGFEVANALALALTKETGVTASKLFHTDRLASIHETRFKGKSLVIIKPTTYMKLVAD